MVEFVGIDDDIRSLMGGRVTWKTVFDVFVVVVFVFIIRVGCGVGFIILFSADAWTILARGLKETVGDIELFSVSLERICMGCGAAVVGSTFIMALLKFLFILMSFFGSEILFFFLEIVASV